MKKIEIANWIENPNRDYSLGVDLLRSCDTPLKVVRMFEARCPRFAMDELVYQLKKKLSSLKEEPSEVNHFPDAKKMVSPQGGQQQLVTELATNLATEHATTDFSSSPASIAKSIVHDLYIEIAKLTNDLYDVGVSNDDASCAKRVDIMNERAGLIERYNRVYDAKELFFAGEISEKELDDIINYRDEVKESAPSDFKDVSDVDLLKRTKAVKACVTRCNNMLQYQSEVAVSNGKRLPENPMPKCPKREKLEKKLAVKLQELIALQSEAQKRGIYGNA